MKPGFKHTIVHPHEVFEGQQTNSIEVTLELCTILKGKPYGLAIIQFTHPIMERKSFRGIGVFNEQGVLNDAQFTYLKGDGSGYSFSKMIDGRPAEGSYATQFKSEGDTQNVDTLKKKVDVGGWQSYSAQINKQGKQNGLGKQWFLDGSIFTGKFQNGFKTEGLKTELEQDGTLKRFKMKYYKDSVEQKLEEKN